MSKAKTASKNNPTTREQAKVHTYRGKKIFPTKIITLTSTFLGAEYEDGEFVTNDKGVKLTWKAASS